MNKSVFVLLFMMLLASCSPDTAPKADWCWTYDFTTSDEGFNIPVGEWVPTLGLHTVSGNLSFSYDHDQFVEPSFVYVAVQRPMGIEGEIPLSVSGIIYGVSASFAMGYTEDNSEVGSPPGTIGTAGKQINVTLDTGNKEIIIQSLTIEGFGATPFPSNPCDPENHTPTPDNVPQVTPTLTPTPSITYTPSNTPTITHTPEGTVTVTETPQLLDFTCVYDFTVDAYTDTWQANGGLATYVSSGWQSISSGSSARLSIRGSFLYSFLETISITYTIGAAANGGTRIYVVNGSSISAFPQSSGTHTALFTINQNADDIRFGIDNNTTGGTNIISNVTLNWNAQYNPCDDVIASTPTPQPTETPTVTNTPTATPTSTTNSGSSTPFMTSTPDTTRTPAGYASPTPQNTLNATEIAQSATAIPDTSTPRPTLTYIPSATRYMTTTPVPGTPGTPGASGTDIYRENEAEYEILEEIKRANNEAENARGAAGRFLGDAFGWFFDLFSGFFDWLGSLIAGIFSFFATIIGLIIEILSIIILFIQLLLGLVGLLLAWIGQVIGRLTALIQAFFTAPLTPIPVMPLCVSDPLSYEICALYYIADWTIFAPGTPGQFIIPLLLAVMNVIIIFRFVRIVLKIISRGEDVTR